MHVVSDSSAHSAKFAILQHQRRICPSCMQRLVFPHGRNPVSNHLDGNDLDGLSLMFRKEEYSLLASKYIGAYNRLPIQVDETVKSILLNV